MNNTGLPLYLPAYTPYAAPVDKSSAGYLGNYGAPPEVVPVNLEMGYYTGRRGEGKGVGLGQVTASIF